MSISFINSVLPETVDVKPSYYGYVEGRTWKGFFYDLYRIYIQKVDPKSLEIFTLDDVKRGYVSPEFFAKGALNKIYSIIPLTTFKNLFLTQSIRELTTALKTGAAWEQNFQSAAAGKTLQSLANSYAQTVRDCIFRFNEECEEAGVGSQEFLFVLQGDKLVSFEKRLVFKPEEDKTQPLCLKDWEMVFKQVQRIKNESKDSVCILRNNVLLWDSRGASSLKNWRNLFPERQATTSVDQLSFGQLQKELVSLSMLLEDMKLSLDRKEISDMLR